MTTTISSPSSDPAVTSRRLLFIGGIVFTAGALLEFASGALNATVGSIPLFSFAAPLVLAAGAVLLALGNIGGRSVLAKIGLFAYAAAFVILLVAVLAAAGGTGIELLFPLGGTMLTLGMLVAGIEIARIGAVGGFARWGLLLVGIVMTLTDLIAFAGLDLGVIGNAGPGIVSSIVQVLLLIATGIAVIVASRRDRTDRQSTAMEH